MDRQRQGFTIIELTLVLVIFAVLLALAFPAGRRSLDRIAVRTAAGDVAATLATARLYALAGHAPVAVDVDSGLGVLRVRRDSEVLFSRAIAGPHGVVLRRTRDSLTYDARGLGRGAANLSVILRRGSAAETVFVSRFGRIR